VDVCVAVPRLSLDRPFTYLLPDDTDAGTGSLVSVPFHGRTVKGWVLGPATEIPAGRLLPVRRVRSSIRFFDPRMLALLRWVSERYLAPLATVIERSHPPRVASEESVEVAGPADALGVSGPGRGALLDAYGGADDLLREGATTWLRPLPRDEVGACVEAVTAALAIGRSALVLVPEAEPVPATGRAVLDRFPGGAVSFLGGDLHGRYRCWLDIKAGRHRVVVGTRPAVFAPIEHLGLIWISREVHPGHREDRAPYYHVREVASARARIHGAACVLASLAPSAETAGAAARGAIRTARPSRQAERAAAPLVETVAPEAEDRSARLGRLLREAGSAALIVSRRGRGVARVCRTCGEPASCGICAGPIVAEAGQASCRVCGAAGVCPHCEGRVFGLERGGTEHVAAWARRQTAVPVALERTTGPASDPSPGQVLLGTAAAVKDVGAQDLDLVAILDPDRALVRPGIHAGEQALATWMEAAAWARSRGRGGRVLVQTRRPGHPAIQALIRWEPVPFLLAEGARRAEAGFPPGHPVFRVAGPGDDRSLEPALRDAGAATVITTPAAGDGTLCLVAVEPGELPRFRRAVLALAARGLVTRVEAEPQL
jgi:primosomal protein N' (replication factor Y) (superfamily II helicase)